MEKLIEKLDGKIKSWTNSKLAPKEFLEEELRRIINQIILKEIKWINFEKVSAYFNDNFFRRYKEELEIDFVNYFDPKNSEIIDNPLRNWKPTYAGCNGQIEWFLRENGLEENIEKLVRGAEIEPSELPTRLKKYFIGIGYLYPTEDKLIVHPNLQLAQIIPYFYSMDSTFLTRDLIRCPYHESNYSNLTDKELWQYWTDLVALSMIGLIPHTLYLAEDFKTKENFDSFLEVGKKLTPNRYVKLEPKIEKFDWLLPEEFIKIEKYLEKIKRF